MAKKASPSAAVAKVAMRVQINVSATTIQASDVKDLEGDSPVLHLGHRPLLPKPICVPHSVHSAIA